MLLLAIRNWGLRFYKKLLFYGMSITRVPVGYFDIKSRQKPDQAYVLITLKSCARGKTYAKLKPLANQKPVVVLTTVFNAHPEYTMAKNIQD